MTGKLSNSDWVALRAKYKEALAELFEADKEIREAMKSEASGAQERGAAASQAAAATAAQEELVSLTKQGWGALVGKYGVVEVYEWWIKFPGGGGPVKGTKVRVNRVGDLTTYNTVDVKVKKKGGLGGALVGGALLGPAGAVIGYGARRKTDVKTTNTPHTVDTRQELVQIEGKGFAYTTEFPGWGRGADLANAISRQSASTTTQAKELAKRQARLDELKRAQESASASGRRASAAAAKAVDEAWETRDRRYRRSVQLWRQYRDARPSLARHVASTIVPGLERGAFDATAPLTLIVAIAAALFSALGTLPSPNIADGVAVVFSVMFVSVLLGARGGEPRRRERPESGA